MLQAGRSLLDMSKPCGRSWFKCLCATSSIHRVQHPMRTPGHLLQSWLRLCSTQYGGTPRGSVDIKHLRSHLGDTLITCACCILETMHILLNIAHEISIMATYKYEDSRLIFRSSSPSQITKIPAYTIHHRIPKRPR